MLSGERECYRNPIMHETYIMREVPHYRESSMKEYSLCVYEKFLIFSFCTQVHLKKHINLSNVFNVLLFSSFFFFILFFFDLFFFFYLFVFLIFFPPLLSILLFLFFLFFFNFVLYEMYIRLSYMWSLGSDHFEISFYIV